MDPNVVCIRAMDQVLENLELGPREWDEGEAMAEVYNYNESGISRSPYGSASGGATRSPLGSSQGSANVDVLGVTETVYNYNMSPLGSSRGSAHVDGLGITETVYDLRDTVSQGFNGYWATQDFSMTGGTAEGGTTPYDPSIDLENVLQALLVQQGLLEDAEPHNGRLAAGVSAPGSRQTTLRNMRRTGPLGALSEDVQTSLLQGTLYEYDANGFPPTVVQPNPHSALLSTWGSSSSSMNRVLHSAGNPRRPGGDEIPILGGEDLGEDSHDSESMFQCPVAPGGQVLGDFLRLSLDRILQFSQPPSPRRRRELLPIGLDGVSEEDGDQLSTAGFHTARSIHTVASSGGALSAIHTPMCSLNSTLRTGSLNTTLLPGNLNTTMLPGNLNTTLRPEGNAYSTGATSSASPYTCQAIAQQYSEQSPQSQQSQQSCSSAGERAVLAAVHPEEGSEDGQVFSGVQVASPVRSFGASGDGVQGSTGHPASVSDVDEDEGVVSVVGFDSPRSALSTSQTPQGAHAGGADIMEDTTSNWGFGDTAQSWYSGTSPQQSARLALGDTLAMDSGVEVGLTRMLQRLAMENLALDESLARSVRRVLQIGTVLTGERLSDEEIRELPKVRFQQAEHQNCAICLEAYQRGELLTAIRCGHFFHVECVGRWFQRSSQCPLCRASCTT